MIVKISDTESLNISQIQSLMVSEVRRYKDTETVLTIRKNDGELVMLHGTLADDALVILGQHGFSF
jgi:hypothetical protein